MNKWARESFPLKASVLRSLTKRTSGRFRRPVQTLALDMPNFGGNREGLGEKFRTYVVLETSWWVRILEDVYDFRE